MRNVCAHLNAFHAPMGDLAHPIETNHYCAHIGRFIPPMLPRHVDAEARLDDEVRQCLVHDSDEQTARLIGVEYMITRDLYETLPPDERRLWHSHVFEVKSGMLAMPTRAVRAAAREVAETREMEHVVSLYSKAYHLWRIDRGDGLPLGEPRLVTSYTADGQFDFRRHVAARNARFGVDCERMRAAREGIEEPSIHGGEGNSVHPADLG